MTLCKSTRLLLFFGGVLLAAGLIATPVRAASEIQLSKGQTVYVPIYSHIYIGDRERPFLLAATLSIRNTDPDHQITVLSVNYTKAQQGISFLSRGRSIRNK